MSTAGPSLGRDNSEPAPSCTIHPAWTPPQGGHIFQPPSPTGLPPPQVPPASHLGLHPLPTGTIRKKGQPPPRAPSGKDGGQVPSRLLLQGLQAPQSPSLHGDCLAGQGICLGPGFGGGHGVCTRPLPRAPFTILHGSRPITDQVESSPEGLEPGWGPGESKTPQKPALLSWETEGELSLSWGRGGRPGV